MNYAADFKTSIESQSSKPSPNPYMYAVEARPLPVSQADGPPRVSQAGIAGKDVAEVPSRPLRVIHVGAYLFGAGIENWLVALVKYSDPARLKFIRCVATTDLVDENIVRRLGVPVNIGGRETVRQAAKDADILLVSGPAEIGEWLSDHPRPPTIFIAHGDGLWTRDILEAVRPSIDHVIAVSHRVQSTVCEGVSTTVIHNSVDPAHLELSRSREFVRNSLGFSQRDFVLGFVGRFSPEKNPLALIETIERLPRQFKLMLVGFGTQRQELLEQTARRIPGRYAFVEAHEHLGDYYLAMDALCLPSLSEGYGLVLMEAMLCGCPVISSPVGFAPESLTHRVNGMIVDGSASSFAETAQLLQRHPHWRQAVAKEGQRYAQRYGLPHRMTSKYAELLEKIAATAKAVQ